MCGYYNDQILEFQKEWRLELQFLNAGKTKTFIGCQRIYPFGDIEEGNPIFFVYPAEISYKSGSGKWVPYQLHGSYDLNSFTASLSKIPFPTLTIKTTQVNHHGDLGFNTTQDRIIFQAQCPLQSARQLPTV